MTSDATVAIHIDALVVHGLSPVDARRAALAFDRRLTELATNDHAAVRHAAVNRRSPTADLRAAPADGSPAGIGHAAAAALWRNLTSTSATPRSGRPDGGR